MPIGPFIGPLALWSIGLLVAQWFLDLSVLGPLAVCPVGIFGPLTRRSLGLGPLALWFFVPFVPLAPLVPWPLGSWPIRP